MAPGTPWERRSRPGRLPGAPRHNPYSPFLTFQAEPGRSRGRFWDPVEIGGGPKTVVFHLKKQYRHLGRPKGRKSPSQRGVQKGVEKRTGNGDQNERFWEA